MLNVTQTIDRNLGIAKGAEINNPNITELYFNPNAPEDKRLDAIEKQVSLMQISLFGNSALNYEGIIHSLTRLIEENERLRKWLVVSTVSTSITVIFLMLTIMWFHYG